MSWRTVLLRAALIVVLVGILGACREKAPATDAGRAQQSPDSAATVAFRDTIALTGTLVDATCHAQADPGDTAACEGKYVQAGYPVGVRAQDDRESVWILVTVPQALADYLTSTVRVTGVVRSQGVLIPHRMEVRKGSTWTSIM